MKRSLFLLLFLVSWVQAQDYSFSLNDVATGYARIHYRLADATDGYTGETGLTPTCTVQAPGTGSYSSCSGSSSEVSNGVYYYVPAASEFENLQSGSFYFTGTGSRPVEISYKSKGWQHAGINPGREFIHFQNLAAGSWTKVFSSVTANSTSTEDSLTIGDTLTGDGTTNYHYTHWQKNTPGTGREVYRVVEVKNGTLNNAWIGDTVWGAGLDINTSTGAVVTSSAQYFKGYKIDKLANGWWRVHILTETPESDSTYIQFGLGLGNGTGSLPSFSTSGTMIFAKPQMALASDVDPNLIRLLRRAISAASSTTSITLFAGENGYLNNSIVNREICLYPANGYGYTQINDGHCTCITAYNQSTKVTTVSPALPGVPSAGTKYEIGGVCLNNITSVATATSVTNTVDAQVVGMDADTIDSTVLASDTITAAKVAADTFGASEIATDAAQEIADITLRRSTTNIEGSSSGDTLGYKSLYGVVAQQTHKTTTGSGVQTVYKADGTTTLNSRSYTSNASAEPITGLD